MGNIGSKTVLFEKVLQEVVEMVVGECGNSTTLVADEVVMRLTRSLPLRRRAARQHVQRAQLGEQVKGAVDGRIVNGGHCLSQCLPYHLYSEMLLKGPDGIEQRGPLGRHAIAHAAQGGDDFFACHALIIAKSCNKVKRLRQQK